MLAIVQGANRRTVLKSLLENGPKATALLSFFVLMLTVFHDWGYFWIIGSKFQSLQTPSDYITNSITWLPLSLALLALYVVAMRLLAEITIFRRIADRDDGESAPLHLRRSRLVKLFNRIAIAGAGSALFSGASWYFAKYPHNAMFGSLGLLTAYLVIFCVAVPRIALWGDPSPKPTLSPGLLILLVPIIINLSFLGGLVEAVVALSSRENVYALRQKAVPDKQVLLLRSLDKGVLTYNLGENKIAFTRWDDLVGIDHTFFPALRKGSICDITDHICNTPEIP